MTEPYLIYSSGKINYNFDTGVLKQTLTPVQKNFKDMNDAIASGDLEKFEILFDRLTDEEQELWLNTFQK